ncbi:hypothetical protein MKW98_011997 [Papaver atlanticum]|uniref:Transmembrane protein n=1 Tax=Papaver atlanticum TaxID=357466 RepID=A0AAD4SQG5_9MAGN|nr:hypothetical protein MKW98_011997 [Papaver atlanticum]
MGVPKTPLSFIGFFFFFSTFVVSQSMNACVLKSRGGAPGDKACLMAPDILGPGSSCGDRLRNGKF